MTKPHPPWCLCCCTMHTVEARCPGELQATGVERHGWRVGVQDGRSVQVIGTLIAPSGRVWRARILTYPKVLWVVPRGGTMKFVGPTAADAEQRAIEYIIEHCQARGITLRREVPALESEAVDPEQESGTAGRADVQASKRTLTAVAVRYGTHKLDCDGLTADLSEGGLFIVTPDPYPRGTMLKLFVEVAGFGVPLSGTVQWTRSSEEAGRASGMGIRLIRPHSRYIQYVRGINPKEETPASSAAPRNASSCPVR